MNHLKRWIFPAIAAGTVGFGALFTQAAQPATQPANTQDLQAQVDQLKAQVQSLQASQQQENQADVTAAIQSVLNDADQNSKAFAIAGGTGGYDPAKGVQITDDAGNFLFHPYLQLDARYSYLQMQNHPLHPSENGFEIRRMKFGFDGYAFTPTLTYKFQWESSDTSGAPFLEDAWAKWMFSDDFGVKLGQFADPLSHENLVDSKFTMGVERSYLNDVMIGQGVINAGDDYVQGISLVYENSGEVRAQLAFTDGDQSQNTDFQNVAANRSNWGASARVEWMAMGETWKDYDQFTSLNDKDNLLVIGIGADETGNFGGGTSDQLLHTIDAQYDMPNGLSAYVGYLGRYTHFHNGHDDFHQDYYDYGMIAQVGYLVTDDIEPFARFDTMYFDSRAGAPFSAAGFHGVAQEISLGANYYLHGHSAKFTVDGAYLPNGSPVSDLSADILANRNGLFVLRAQFQLAI